MVVKGLVKFLSKTNRIMWSIAIPVKIVIRKDWRPRNLKLKTESNMGLVLGTRSGIILRGEGNQPCWLKVDSLRLLILGGSALMLVLMNKDTVSMARNIMRNTTIRGRCRAKGPQWWEILLRDRDSFPIHAWRRHHAPMKISCRSQQPGNLSLAKWIIRLSRITMGPSASQLQIWGPC